MKHEKHLTMKEVMQILRVSKSTLINWDKKGTLKAIRLPNGYRRWRVSDIEAILQQHEC